MFKAKPSKCKICGETLRSRNKLWEHVKTEHDMREMQYRKIYGDPEKPEEEKMDENRRDYTTPAGTNKPVEQEEQPPELETMMMDDEEVEVPPEIKLVEEEVEPEINIVDYQMIPYSGIVAIYKDGSRPVVALGTVTYNRSISQLSPLVLTPEGLVIPAFLLEEFSEITVKKDGVKTKKKPRFSLRREKVKKDRRMTKNDIEKTLTLLNRR